MTAWLPFGDGVPERIPPVPEVSGPDPDLAWRLAARLRTVPRAWGQHIVVEVQHGVVILEGSVSSLAARDAIVAAARGVDGVRDVCTLLRVAGSAAAGGFQAAGADGMTVDEFIRSTAALRQGDPVDRTDLGPPRRASGRIRMSLVAGTLVLWIVVVILLVGGPAPGPMAAAATAAVLAGLAVVGARRRSRPSGTG